MTANVVSIISAPVMYVGIDERACRWWGETGGTQGQRWPGAHQRGKTGMRVYSDQNGRRGISGTR